jgi:hypothetical protein
MASQSRKTRQDELMRVQSALDKGENPLSCKELHFIQTCCQILKLNSNCKIHKINTTASQGGRGDLPLMITAF